VIHYQYSVSLLMLLVLALVFDRGFALILTHKQKQRFLPELTCFGSRHYEWEYFDRTYET